MPVFKQLQYCSQSVLLDVSVPLVQTISLGCSATTEPVTSIPANSRSANYSFFFLLSSN